MGVNFNLAISHMYALRARGVTYSMMGSRIGTDGTADCSGAVYASLVAAGMPRAAYVLNTESMHAWLLGHGYKLVAENHSWAARRGDVFIWGRKGYSGGAGGHTGIFIDSKNVIHCNYANNGVSVNRHAAIWAADGRPYYYIYRYVGVKKTVKKPTIKWSLYNTDADVKSRNSGWFEVTRTSDLYRDRSFKKKIARLPKYTRLYAKGVTTTTLGYPCLEVYYAGTICYMTANKAYAKLLAFKKK